VRLEPPPSGIDVKERDIEQGRRLKGNAEAHVRVAALDPPHRDAGDADPLSQLVKRPAAFTPCDCDHPAEQLSGFTSGRGVWAILVRHV
jgi:hypothetical protein